jgi:hypothetical protein
VHGSEKPQQCHIAAPHLEFYNKYASSVEPRSTLEDKQSKLGIKVPHLCSCTEEKPLLQDVRAKHDEASIQIKNGPAPSFDPG